MRFFFKRNSSYLRLHSVKENKNLYQQGVTFYRNLSIKFRNASNSENIIDTHTDTHKILAFKKTLLSISAEKFCYYVSCYIGEFHIQSKQRNLKLYQVFWSINQKRILGFFNNKHTSKLFNSQEILKLHYSKAR